LSQSQFTAVLHLERNLNGRDFVVGDIHGHFELFDLLLKAIKFNPAVDRMISVGDTIDRGPESERALHYWKQPWFYLVRGNHEAMLAGSIDLLTGMSNLWMKNGGEWSFDVPESMLDEMAEIYKFLPYAISIETPHGEVGIVHADLPAHRSWTKLIKGLQKNKTKESDVKALLWSRETYRKYRMSREYGGVMKESFIQGIHKVYVGHSIVRNPALFGNTMFIDTGAYCNGRLTAIDLMTEDVIIVQPKRDKYESV